MTGDVQPFERGWVPWCEKCQRRVEWVGWETPIQTVNSFERGPHMVHTGEIIVTIRCHGEAWAMSNWRGRIEPRPENNNTSSMRF